MLDNFVQYATALDSPGEEHYDITPSNTVDEQVAFRSVYVGVTGDVVIVSLKGVAKTYKNAAQGSTIPMRGKRVNATGTTATNLIGMY